MASRVDGLGHRVSPEKGTAKSRLPETKFRLITSVIRADGFIRWRTACASLVVEVSDPESDSSSVDR